MNDIRGHLINYIAGGMLLLTFALFALGFYWVVIDDNPPMVPELPMTVNRAEYHAGDTIHIGLAYCRYTDASSTLYITYVNQNNGHIFPLVSEEVNSLPIQCATVFKEETLPMMDPGTYIRQSRIEYHVNPLANRTVELYTEEFEIIPEDE